MFQVRVNGRSNAKQTVTVRATVSSGGSVVDQAAASFTSSGGAVTSSDVAPIASAFVRSRRLVALAQALRGQRDRQAQVKQDQEDRRQSAAQAIADRDKQKADELAWLAARPIVCQEPRRVDACDGVQKYLADFPGGRHADEAKAALEQAKPKLEKVQKDENAWATSGADTCRRDHTKTACAGVEIYLSKFVGGLHGDEGNALLEGL
jgi:hypothetical protein